MIVIVSNGAERLSKEGADERSLCVWAEGAIWRLAPKGGVGFLINLASPAQARRMYDYLAGVVLEASVDPAPSAAKARPAR